MSVIERVRPPRPPVGGNRHEPRLRLHVTEATMIATDIRSLTFADARGTDLPPYPAGSHLVVDCGGTRNAYSLTGAGTDPHSYTISVLLREDGRGGSRHLHTLDVGDAVWVSRPRSSFAPVANARAHLLIAGGIGITPLLSHAAAAQKWKRRTHVLYCHRPGAGAHLEQLRKLCGDNMETFEGRAAFLHRLHEALRSQPVGTHLYVCGPQAFTDTVLNDALGLGWPVERLHTERFSAPELEAGAAFHVTLARSGRTVEVPSGVSLLEALEGAGIAVPNLCRQGVCGECRVPVVSGTPLHRDLYLDEDERSAGDSVMCCISRSLDDHLELNL